MKNLTTIALIFSAFVFASTVHAGGGHAHDEDGGHSNHGHSDGPISADKVKTRATSTMQSLVKKDVINKSWNSIKAAKAEKKNFGKSEEWVVSFKNDKVKDKSKQTLYIFYSLDGHYIAANYSGK